MLVLVVIGDVVSSRAVADRPALQTRLEGALETVNRNRDGLLSPYTLTLGDEFQGVLGNHRALWDAVDVQAAVHPTMIRFSCAVGEIVTALNPERSLGMDGPAFHDARAGIDALKKAGNLYRVSGLHAEVADLANASLNLVSHMVSKWKTSRFRIMAALLRQRKVADIARQLEISEQGVYKNISEGRMEDVREILAVIGSHVDTALSSGR